MNQQPPDYELSPILAFLLGLCPAALPLILLLASYRTTPCSPEFHHLYLIAAGVYFLELFLTICLPTSKKRLSGAFVSGMASMFSIVFLIGIFVYLSQGLFFCQWSGPFFSL